MTDEPKKIFILNTLVGSHAHGLAEEGSDKDYRGVYVVPTRDLLSLNFDGKKVLWEEGERDQTGYEVGHFLQLALKGVPNILEVFVAKRTIVDFDSLGFELRELLPYIFDRKAAFGSFLNYASNQRKKMLDNHENRWNKYAVAYIRTLYNLVDLMIDYRRFDIEVTNQSTKKELLAIKAYERTTGSIIDLGEGLIRSATMLFKEPQESTLDVNKTNNFLLKVRREFWHG